jgi:hypothetical protein
MERSTRLVESNVGVAADADEQEIETAECGKVALEPCAFDFVIASAAIQEVHVIAGQVDPVEQMLLHECAIAPFIARREPHEFVDVEGMCASETRFAGFMKPGELVVNREGRPTRWQSEHGRGLAGELRSDGAGRGMRRFLCRPEDTNVHVMFAR